MKRTRYREVIRELGEILNMNWAYAVEFPEIDTRQLGTDTFDDAEDEQSREQLLEEFKVGKNRLRGALAGIRNRNDCFSNARDRIKTLSAGRGGWRGLWLLDWPAHVPLAFWLFPRTSRSEDPVQGRG